jgi:carbamoyltransferase
LTIVIGFTFPCSHDNAVAVVIDGRLVFAAEEERYTRHKYSELEPPFNSLVRALNFLKSLGFNPEEVDAFATNWDSSLFSLRWRMIRGLVEQTRAGNPYMPLLGFRPLPNHLLNWAYHRFNFSFIARAFVAMTYRHIHATLPDNLKIYAIEHHLAHAASAYYFSGFLSSIVLTIDGYGERDSTVVWRVRNGDFEKLASVTVEEGSVGMLYEYVSRKLNFSYLEGPGKVMGLAPYGKYDERIGPRFEALAKVDMVKAPYVFADGFRMKSRARNLAIDVDAHYSHLADLLTDGLSLDWNPKMQPTECTANLAWQIQQFTERIVVQSAKWAKEQVKEKNISLAGGVALNAKANMSLRNAGLYEDLFIFPAANDAGGAIGAAAYTHENILGEKMRHGRLEDVYLGLAYDNALIKEIVRKGNWPAEYVGDNPRKVADLVSQGQLIAWYQGRGELGPRALGNRSIIADPTRADTWKRMNGLKGREYWRPLAPSVISEDAPFYFQKPADHRFMVLMFEMTEEGSKRAPAICHVDMTSRPQVVGRESNRVWYDLIRSLKDINGGGIITNTSFNLAGEPIVETPQEAIKSFAVGGFDALYLQGWLIKKHP